MIGLRRAGSPNVPFKLRETENYASESTREIKIGLRLDRARFGPAGEYEWD